MAEPISRDDLAVTLAVRNDLTPVHDDAVIGEFLDRVGAQIDARVDERLGAVARPVKAPDAGLAKFSLIMGIPISAIALDGSSQHPVTALLALGIAWVGVAAVNLAHLRRT